MRLKIVAPDGHGFVKVEKGSAAFKFNLIRRRLSSCDLEIRAISIAYLFRKSIIWNRLNTPY